MANHKPITIDGKAYTYVQIAAKLKISRAAAVARIRRTKGRLTWDKLKGANVKAANAAKLRERIISLSARLSAAEVAAKCGCTRSYVYLVLREVESLV